jgi:hypothetical protein
VWLARRHSRGDLRYPDPCGLTAVRNLMLPVGQSSVNFRSSASAVVPGRLAVRLRLYCGSSAQRLLSANFGHSDGEKSSRSNGR